MPVRTTLKMRRGNKPQDRTNEIYETRRLSSKLHKQNKISPRPASPNRLSNTEGAPLSLFPGKPGGLLRLGEVTKKASSAAAATCSSSSRAAARRLRSGWRSMSMNSSPLFICQTWVTSPADTLVKQSVTLGTRSCGRGYKERCQHALRQRFKHSSQNQHMAVVCRPCT
jgi:hypothetical protein